MLRFFKRNRKENIEHTQDAVNPSRDRWFGKILNVLRSSELDNSVWEELEEILISSDVGVETSLRLIEELKNTVKEKGLETGEDVFASLKESLVAGMESENAESVWMDETEVSGPYVILMVGVNGVGKTTSIAKLAHHFTQEGKKVILGAADTFRAAAAEQLEILGGQIGVDVIRHEAGGDPGAVAFDAYQASKARGADVLIIDTAGRLHTKSNLMEELRKVHRVLTRLEPQAPHQVILTLDAKSFKDAVNCTGIFLAKLDGTARGGIVLAIKQELQVPILFIGTGEGVNDLAPFDTRDFVESLLAPIP
mgnify:CR=1 FL=1